MTKRRRASPTPPQGPNEAVTVTGFPGETVSRSLARALTEPGMRHSGAINAFASKLIIGGEVERPGAGDYADALADMLKRAGDPKDSKRMLAAQAFTLDSVFTELLRRSAANLGEYPEAAERFLRLAMKAQGNARATLEALARLNDPPPAPPRLVQLRDNAQAVIAGQIYHHAGAAILEDQSHATATIGPVPAMLGENPERWPVPGSGGEGQG